MEFGMRDAEFGMRDARSGIRDAGFPSWKILKSAAKNYQFSILKYQLLIINFYK